MKEQVWFTMKFYSAVKREKLTHATTWVKSQDVLSETSQPQGTDAGTPLYGGTGGSQFRDGRKWQLLPIEQHLQTTPR